MYKFIYYFDFVYYWMNIELIMVFCVGDFCFYGKENVECWGEKNFGECYFNNDDVKNDFFVIDIQSNV